jgi:hypothetical protein
MGWVARQSQLSEHANCNYESDLVPFFDGHGPPQLTYGLHSIRLRSVEQEQTQS